MRKYIMNTKRKKKYFRSHGLVLYNASFKIFNNLALEFLPNKIHFYF